jgi:cell wall assembly regulator SMI1
MTIAESWRRIDSWLAREAPEVAASLGAGASPEDLDAADLPRELRDSMAIHQAQRDELCLFEGQSLLGVAESLEERRGMLRLREEFESDYRAIGSEYWGLDWFPFLSDRSGSYLCVETRSGRVIAFVHDQPDRLVVASSVDAFLRQIADAMESDECVVDDVGVWLHDRDHALARALWGEDAP